MKRGEWAKQFLSALGNSNPTDQTVNFVSAWTLGENTPARYNPLGTKEDMGADCIQGDFNVVGVKNYKSNDCGVQASVKTLTNGRYPHIYEGLRANDPDMAANAVELSVWGTGAGVIALWRTGDHRNEDLPSHRSFSEIADSIEGKSDARLVKDDPVSDVVNSVVPDLSFDSQSIARNLTFIGIGGALLALSLVIAIKTFVPVQQVVKTVASVAA